MDKKETYVTVETHTVKESMRTQNDKECFFYCEKLIIKDKEEK